MERISLKKILQIPGFGVSLVLNSAWRVTEIWGYETYKNLLRQMVDSTILPERAYRL